MQSVAMANPHEPREVGPYTLTVGFRIEPAFEDVPMLLIFRDPNIRRETHQRQ
ncbi:MAG: hypothetical protein MRJ67_01760 [Nitrospirales bacterium]|nr:hypothetical protein [Nitrospirales bacterium]